MPPLPGLEGTSCLHPLRRSGEGAVGGAGAGEDGGDGGVAGGTIGHGDRGLREKPGLPLEEGRSAMSVGFEELAHFRRERPDISAWIGVHAKRILCAMDEPTVRPPPRLALQRRALAEPPGPESRSPSATNRLPHCSRKWGHDLFRCTDTAETDSKKSLSFFSRAAFHPEPVQHYYGYTRHALFLGVRYSPLSSWSPGDPSLVVRSLAGSVGSQARDSRDRSSAGKSSSIYEHGSRGIGSDRDLRPNKVPQGAVADPHDREHRRNYRIGLPSPIEGLHGESSEFRLSGGAHRFGRVLGIHVGA